MSKLRSCSFSAVILLLGVLAFSATVAMAQAPVTDDAFVTQTSADNNFGNQNSLALQAGAQPTYSYMKFNLSQVPASSTVTKATLRLFVTAATTPGAFDIRLANGLWSESVLTWNNQPGSGPGSLVVGGSCTSPIPATADPTHPQCITAGQVNGYVIIDITSQVQAWITTPASNYGIVLVPTSGYSTSVAFDSKESAATSHDPTLDIILAGAQGPAGSTGPQGPQGLQGPIGVTGASGPAGPTGAQGPQGIPGLNFKGAWSSSSSYAVGDVVTHGGSSYTAVAPIAGQQVSGIQIPTSAWHVQFVDSQATDCGNYAATNAFDGNGNTLWLTEWCHSTPPPPHEIQIDLGASYNIIGFQYLPRQEAVTTGNGNVKNYEFYVSSDGVNWGAPVATGILMSVASDKTQKQVSFAVVAGRYVRFRALSEVHGGPWTDVAELHVIQPSPSGGGGNPTPDTDTITWALVVSKGDTGAAGPQGSQGLAGATGATGSQGPQGLTGAAGAEGSAGPTGLQGLIGLTGATGLQGSKGDTGANGQGFAEKGGFVLNNSYAANDVVTFGGASYVALLGNAGAANPDADATNWALFAAQGLKGDAGAAGAAGATGPQGTAGA
ncbi:MAG: DNRLRE domain-containing protein, partial [Terriglobales bacterium]